MAVSLTKWCIKWDHALTDQKVRLYFTSLNCRLFVILTIARVKKRLEFSSVKWSRTFLLVNITLITRDHCRIVNKPPLSIVSAQVVDKRNGQT